MSEDGTPTAARPQAPDVLGVQLANEALMRGILAVALEGRPPQEASRIRSDLSDMIKTTIDGLDFGVEPKNNTFRSFAHTVIDSVLKV